MWFKLTNEEGSYVDVATNEPRNLLDAENTVYTPEGENVGWTELSSIEEAERFFNVKRVDIGE